MQRAECQWHSGAYIVGTSNKSKTFLCPTERVSITCRAHATGRWLEGFHLLVVSHRRDLGSKHSSRLQRHAKRGADSAVSAADVMDSYEGRMGERALHDAGGQRLAGACSVADSN